MFGGWCSFIHGRALVCFSGENDDYPNYGLLLKMAIEIVDLPTKNGDFQQLC
jgi:hypothetical protein